MFSPHDTIVAVATPPGRGGIGVVRISGANARAVAQAILDRRSPLEPRHATFARVMLPAIETGHGLPPDADPGRMKHLSLSERAIDQVVATFFPGPHSYTGDDVAEISGHGSPLLLQQVVCAAIAAGARLAEPGEFTLRAFLNERLDLVQAEAVADLIDAVTPRQARQAFDQLEGTLTAAIQQIHGRIFDLAARLEASLDFPDEGYHFVESGLAASEIAGIMQAVDELLEGARRGRLIREGRTVAIVGRPNTGKSSLFNSLLQANRAIVTATPGTTRDLLTEIADIDGIPITLVDTAGIRESADAIEAEGVARARLTIGVADLLLVVVDRSQPLTAEDRAFLTETSSRARLVAVNKIDLPAAWNGDSGVAIEDDGVEVSAATGHRIDILRRRIAQALGDRDSLRDAAPVANVRHIGLLQRSNGALARAHQAASDRSAEELVLADLHDARTALESITGPRTSEDLLAHIFARFCIGK